MLESRNSVEFVKSESMITNVESLPVRFSITKPDSLFELSFQKSFINPCAVISEVSSVGLSIGSIPLVIVVMLLYPDSVN